LALTVAIGVTTVVVLVAFFNAGITCTLYMVVSLHSCLDWNSIYSH